MDGSIEDKSIDNKPAVVFDGELKEEQFLEQDNENEGWEYKLGDEEFLLDNNQVKLENPSETEPDHCEFEIFEFQTESECATESDEEEQNDDDNSADYQQATQKKQKQTALSKASDLCTKTVTPFDRPKNSCIYCGHTVHGNHHYQAVHYGEHKELDDDKIVFVCPSCGDEFSTETMWQKHCNEIHKLDELSSLSMVPMQSDAGDSFEKVQCMTCSATLRKVRYFLLIHASIHMPYKMFKCRYCTALFGKKETIRTHFCAQFEEVLKLKLPPIDYVALANAQREREHCNLAYVCPVCGEEFDLKLTWQEHLTAEHEISSGIENINVVLVPGKKDNYKCGVCNKTWNRQYTRAMRRHAFAHMPFKWRKCKICKHSSDGLSSCYCQQQGKSKFKLNLAHIEDCTLLCTKCGASLENFTELNNHYCTAHNIRTPEDLNFKLLGRKDGKRFLSYECIKCQQPSAATPFQAQSYTQMFVHALKHDNADWLKCKNCDSTYRCAFNMKNHAYACLSGSESLRAYKSYKRHVLSTCPACGKSNTSKTDFRKHIISDHGFSNISNLNIVVKQRVDIKNMETQYQCTICEHPFTSYLLKKLQNHAFLHMPFKLYNCKICNLGFDTQVEIMEHLKHVHSIQKSKPRAAKQCGKLLPEDENVKVRPAKKCKRTQKKSDNTNKSSVENKPKRKKVARRNENKDTTATPVDDDPLLVESTTLAEISKIRTFSSDGATMLEFGEHITYACPECNVPLATQTDYQTHITLHHNFFDEDQLNTIRMPDNKMQCIDCGVMVEPTLSHRQRHKLTHLPYQSYICALCGHRSNTAFVLVGHIRRRHFSAGAYKCPVCELVLETSYKCVLHCRAQHTAAEYPQNVCQICMVTYKDSTTLRRHTEVHDFNRKVYKCLKCEPQRVYKTEREFQKHLKSLHLELVSTNSEPVNCLICQQSFKDRLELGEHIKTQHDDDQDNLDPLVCKHCHRRFTRRMKLICHTDAMHSPQTPQKPFPCDQCDGRFAVKRSLDYHWKKNHWKMEITMSKKQQEDQQEVDQLIQNAKEINCLICQQMFSDRSAVAAHIKAQHSDEKVELDPLVCKHCHQRFTRLSMLTIHMDAVRAALPQLQSFPCDQCDLRFARKNDLVHHWKTCHFGMQITMTKKYQEDKIKKSVKIVQNKTIKQSVKRRLRKSDMKTSASDESDESIADTGKLVVKRMSRPRKRINYDESHVKGDVECNVGVVNNKDQCDKPSKTYSDSNDDIIMECKPDVSTMMTTVPTKYTADYVCSDIKEEFLSD